jgi:hypothetical protein
MVPDQPVGQVHDLGDLCLVTVRGLARILPHQALPVVQEPAGFTVPAHELVRAPAPAFLEEAPELGMPAQHAPVGVEDGRDDRRFQRRVGRVERQQAVDVHLAGVPVPKDVDALGIRFPLRHAARSS